MGLRGPPPKPTAIKKLEGNPGGHSLNKFEPKPQLIKSVEPPAWMKARAKVYWCRVVPILSQMGVLSEAELPLLERYCEFLAVWHHCREFLEERGDICYPIYDKVLNKDGSKRVKFLQEYPHLNKQIRISDHLLKIEAHFGMTPAARSRIIDEELYNNPLSAELSEDDPYDPPSLN